MISVRSGTGFPKTGEWVITGKGVTDFHTSSKGLPSKLTESVIRGIITAVDESNTAPETQVVQDRNTYAGMMLNLRTR